MKPAETARLAVLAEPMRALAVAVVPEAGSLDPAGWEEYQRLVERALRLRPPKLRRQLALLIRGLDLLALLRWGRRLHALDPLRRRRLLEALQDAPVLLLRRGIWGLRTLLLLGYYGRAEAASAIGYRADPRGWDARQ